MCNAQACVVARPLRVRAGVTIIMSALSAVIVSQSSLATSVASTWDNQLLAAIRIDTPRPTVHARNLFHASAAMYDAWSAYDATSVGYLYRQRESATDVEAARSEAISFAAFNLLSHRFANSPGAATALPALRNQMTSLGYDPNFTSVVGSSPAAAGNRIAASYLARGLIDGSNEASNYADTSGYVPSNAPLVVSQSGTTMASPGTWQPLTILVNNVPRTQSFLTPQWGGVVPFAVTRTAGTPYGTSLVGAPPAFGSPQFKAEAMQLIRMSSTLDPTDNVMIDRSPGVFGNNPLGTNAGSGHALNPVTGQPVGSPGTELEFAL